MSSLVVGHNSGDEVCYFEDFPKFTMISTEALEALVKTIVQELRPAVQPAQGHGNAEAAMSALVSRLPTFSYDPDNGSTFELWYTRCQAIIETDGAALDEAAKVRLVTFKLDPQVFQRYVAHILPRKHSEIGLEETIKLLKDLFGPRGSLVSRRYAYLQSRCEDTSSGTYDDYTGLVNQRHEVSEMSTITADQMKCLVWICGLKGGQHDTVRQLALQYVEEHPDKQLRDLHHHVKQFGQLQRTSRLIAGSQTGAVGGVQAGTGTLHCTRCNGAA